MIKHNPSLQESDTAVDTEYFSDAMKKIPLRERTFKLSS